MLEIEPKSRDRVYKVKTFGTLHFILSAKRYLDYKDYLNAKNAR